MVRYIFKFVIHVANDYAKQREKIKAGQKNLKKHSKVYKVCKIYSETCLNLDFQLESVRKIINKSTYIVLFPVNPLSCSSFFYQ